MRLDRSFQNVTRFQALPDGNCSFVDKEGVLFLSRGNDLLRVKPSNNKYASIQYLEGLLLAKRTGSKETDFYSLDLEYRFTSEYSFLGRCNFPSDDLYVRLSQGEEDFLAQFDNADLKVFDVRRLNVDRWRSILTSEDSAINYGSDGITKVESESGNEIWRVSYQVIMGEYCVSSSSPIVMHDQILLTLKVPEPVHNPTYFLISLDLHTGEVITPPTPFSVHIDRDGDCVYGNDAHGPLYIYHVPTGEIRKINVMDLVTAHGFFSLQEVIKAGTKLYFTQYIGALYAKAGIMDYERQQMLWTHDFDEDEGSIGGLRVADGYVYFHMQDRTLHVFKED